MYSESTAILNYYSNDLGDSNFVCQQNSKLARFTSGRQLKFEVKPLVENRWELRKENLHKSLFETVLFAETMRCLL